MRSESVTRVFDVAWVPATRGLAAERSAIPATNKTVTARRLRRAVRNSRRRTARGEWRSAQSRDAKYATRTDAQTTAPSSLTSRMPAAAAIARLRLPLASSVARVTAGGGWQGSGWKPQYGLSNTNQAIGDSRPPSTARRPGRSRAPTEATRQAASAFRRARPVTNP